MHNHFEKKKTQNTIYFDDRIDFSENLKEKGIFQTYRQRVEVSKSCFI